jgi:hypothetical protein
MDRVPHVVCERKESKTLGEPEVKEARRAARYMA